MHQKLHIKSPVQYNNACMLTSAAEQDTDTSIVIMSLYSCLR
ncbi:hypothetical protein BDA96_02G064800 [Sorghum bicolor]|uniref:Uncharacterized protein n=2 Tax=Sorghum bicolor TaxID=4558 RepID=A0A921RLT0_SORBI|nr:hypothetical protein BDA96_02G064800 [Sorghum bicolor]OQU88627.1 hypothetical protein SORBI_3002G064450 [Sorghum bicolor]